MATPKQQQVLEILNDPNRAEEFFMNFSPADLAEPDPTNPGGLQPAAPTAAQQAFDPLAQAAPPAGPQPGAPPAGGTPFETPGTPLTGAFAAPPPPPEEEEGKLEEIARSVGRAFLARLSPELTNIIDRPQASRGLDEQVLQGQRGGLDVRNTVSGVIEQERAPAAVPPKELTDQPLVGKAFLDRDTDDTIVATTQNLPQIIANPRRFEPLGGRGQNITTNVDVDTGARELTKSAQTDLQDRLRRAPAIIERMANMDRNFEAGFQTIFGSGGEAEMLALTTLDRTAPNLLSPEQAARVQKRTTFKQEAFDNINAIIREITGAQMSAPEAERIIRQLPDPQSDSPIEFKTKMDNSRVKIGLAFLRDRQLLEMGEFPERAEDVLTLNDVRETIISEWEEIASAAFNEAVAQGMDRDTAKQSARIASDHLLESKYGGIPITVLKRMKNV